MTTNNSDNALLAAVEQLPNLVAITMTKDMKQRDAIKLLDQSTLSNARIATILGTTADTVRGERNRLKRAEKGTAKVKEANDATGVEG